MASIDHSSHPASAVFPLGPGWIALGFKGLIPINNLECASYIFVDI